MSASRQFDPLILPLSHYLIDAEQIGRLAEEFYGKTLELAGVDDEVQITFKREDVSEMNQNAYREAFKQVIDSMYLKK